MEKYVLLSWGNPKGWIKRVDTEDGKVIKLTSAVEDSVNLSVTKGAKQEANIEGGSAEAIKYAFNKYALAWNIRQAKDRNKPVEDFDGVIEGVYSFWLQPENPTVPGIFLPRINISVEDTFTAKEGGIWAYTFDTLADPEGQSKQVQWGVVTAPSGDGDPTFKAIGAEI